MGSEGPHLCTEVGGPDRGAQVPWGAFYPPTTYGTPASAAPQSNRKLTANARVFSFLDHVELDSPRGQVIERKVTLLGELHDVARSCVPRISAQHVSISVVFVYLLALLCCAVPNIVSLLRYLNELLESECLHYRGEQKNLYHLP